jgi:hypothetical protein
MFYQKLFFVFLIFIIQTGHTFAEITVTSVKGQAKFKTGNQWVALTQGTKLAEGSKISTGINSNVVLNINGDTITIKPMTMVKVEENSVTSTESNTRLGLKRGGLNARISKLKTLKTSFKITTPVATSSVRGTEEEVFYGPGMGMIIKVIEGEILAQNNFGASNLLRGRLGYSHGSNSSTPGNVNSSRQEGSRGGLIILNLTPEEINYLLTSSDIIYTTDQNNNPFFSFFTYQGTGNVHITPVFP